MHWKFGAAADIGSRSEQQDRFALLHSPDGQRHLLVVADGMGGLQHGALAAQTLVDTATQYFETQPVGSPRQFLQAICEATHQAINSLQESADATVGTTAVLLYFDHDKATWAHIGDSRLYHFRGGKLLTRTNDHSLRQLMLTNGVVNVDSPAAQAMQNQLYMRFGGEQPPEPDFNASPVQDGDVFMLCSDGLWQTVEPDEMLATLQQHATDQDGAQALVALARQRNGERSDNISLIVAQCAGAVGGGFWQSVLNFFSKAKT